MKQIITIILACCILFSNTGWALTTHYCMGERVGLNLEHAVFADDTHECARCGMTKTGSDNGCCKDERISVKNSDAATLSVYQFQIQPYWADLPVSKVVPFYAQPLLSDSFSKAAFHAHGPPAYTGPPLFIKYCVFLI